MHTANFDGIGLISMHSVGCALFLSLQQSDANWYGILDCTSLYFKQKFIILDYILPSKKKKKKENWKLVEVLRLPSLSHALPKNLCALMLIQINDLRAHVVLQSCRYKN